jgi:two-component system, OmpR family, sensor kinase
LHMPVWRQSVWGKAAADGSCDESQYLPEMAPRLTAVSALLWQASAMSRTPSIRHRFSTVFLFVLLVVIILGIFSIWRLTDYYTFSAEIQERFLRSTQYIGDLNNFTSDFRAAEGTALLISNPGESEANDKERAELDRRIALAQHSYEHVNHDKDEAGLYAKFTARWSSYRGIASRVLGLAAGGQRPEAVVLYLTNSRAAYDAASDTLGELTDLNVAKAQRAGLRADVAYRGTRLLTAVAVGFAGLFVVGGLLYMRRSIAAPLLDLAQSMRGLAGNDTGVYIPGIKRSDDIGEMARAVVVFRDNVIDLAINQRALANQASLLAEKLAAEQRLTQLQRNFVSMASHEFRTPLTVIDGHAQRLINAKDRLGPDDVVERAKKIRSAVLRITSVIENLIDSSRLIEGDAELYFHPTEIDLAPLLNEVCRLHREVVPRAQIVQNLGTQPLPMVGDQKLLFQVFSNLLSNAIKYSPEGSLIKISSASQSGQIVVVIEDRGVGIPEPDIERLFERYFRGSNVSGIVGTGVGLYLVKTVVDLHGGDIAVESREGKGSAFSVRLRASLPVRATELTDQHLRA